MCLYKEGENRVLFGENNHNIIGWEWSKQEERGGAA